ncbi:MAG TPA: Mini-ribonuclease 3 [Clostridiaceae bacterium]|jgi:ribonuclease-3 family protein|nr:Mini-ribonuclease 3 [Clostridiaceae bacterium]
MIEELSKEIFLEINLKKRDIREYSPLVLAYLGDAVYELFIRTLVLSEGNAPVCKLHKLSTGYVKAEAQSATIHKILESLTPDEQDVVRRGRNAKPGTVPKNADIVEYKYATGFETLLGYLYLNQDYTRMMQILKMCIQD